MVKNLTDGRYTYDSMKPCPFCQKPVAIEYISECGYYAVTHVEENDECPMADGVVYGVPEDRADNYHNAIEMWNVRCGS